MNTLILPHGWVGLDGSSRLLVGYAIAEKIAYELDAKRWEARDLMLLFEALESLIVDLPKDQPGTAMLDETVTRMRTVIRKAITATPAVAVHVGKRRLDS